MTPEEFRARAETALAPVDPGPESYDRLRASVARRRSRWAGVAWGAAATAVVVALVAAAVVLPRDAAPTATDVAPSPPTPFPTKPAGVPGDFNGDGRPDGAKVVESGTAGTASWRWGVQVQYGAGGEQTVWFEDAGRRWAVTRAPEIAAVVDLDGNDIAEVVVRAARSRATTAYVVLARSEWVRWEDNPEPHYFLAGVDHGWGCRDLNSAYLGREVFLYDRAQPAAEAYALFGAELNRVPIQGAGRDVGFAAGGVDCAPLTEGHEPPGPAERQPADAVSMDVDGDGTADRARVVEEPGRWGVRLDMSRLGTATLWMPGDLGADAHRIDASTDVDGDGRAEILVAVNDHPSLTHWALVMLVGDEPAWLRSSDGVEVLREGQDGPQRVTIACADISPEPGPELIQLYEDAETWVLVADRVVEGRVVGATTDKGPAPAPVLRSCVLGE